MEDIVTARMNYSRLDDEASKVRIRLNSTAIHVKHRWRSREREGSRSHLRSRRKGAPYSRPICVLACYNMVIPYLCPEMSEKQREALAYAVKIPLVYTNVQIKNWKAFQKLGVDAIYAPGSYFSNITLDFPVSMGEYKFPEYA